MMDLIRDIEVVVSGSSEKPRNRTVFIQPGLRYAQAEALITSLMQDEMFRDLGIRNRMRVTERILDEIKGRMMEDMVLLETSLSDPEKRVFPLQFAVGEFDMVVFDPQSLTCLLYEIKHSSQIVPQQYRHLTDADKIRETEKQYGEIAGRFVIYTGAENSCDGIEYLNVENYLLNL